MVRYTGSRHDALRYCCHRGWMDNGEPLCIAFGGAPLDEAIAREVLRVVQPGALEAAAEVARDAESRCDEAADALRRDLEAARYEADRAARQHDAVDPANRLVADELETRWNRALERVAEIEGRVAECDRQRDGEAPSFDGFEALAADLETVWRHPGASPQLKKRIVRCLVREVVVDVDADAGEIAVVVHWQGGVHTELGLPRRWRGRSTANPKEAVAAARALVRVCLDDVIAGVLNRNGLRTGRGNRWTCERVASLRNWAGIPRHDPQAWRTGGWMNLRRPPPSWASVLERFGWRPSGETSRRSIRCRMAPECSTEPPSATMAPWRSPLGRICGPYPPQYPERSPEDS